MLIERICGRGVNSLKISLTMEATKSSSLYLFYGFLCCFALTNKETKPTNQTKKPKLLSQKRPSSDGFNHSDLGSYHSWPFSPTTLAIRIIRLLPICFISKLGWTAFESDLTWYFQALLTWLWRKHDPAVVRQGTAARWQYQEWLQGGGLCTSQSG